MEISKPLSEDAVLRELGSRISQYRLNRNLTQAQLAQEAGVSLSTVSRMEAGSSSQISNLVRVLRALDLVENLDLLIPAPAVSPIQQLQLDGKSRRRARPGKETKSVAAGPWAWDEETTAKLEKRQRDPDEETRDREH